MNLMSVVLEERKLTGKDAKKFGAKVEELKNIVKKEKIKISQTIKKIGNSMYCVNALPYIASSRDVLKKPDSICSIRVNWKKKSFAGLTTEQMIKELKEQWCWYTSIVDEEHSRNKFKNKDIICVVFDTKEEAEKNMEVFKKMFMTAIEQDCVEEYKKFKQNPDKRILSFDKLVDNAYDLYEQVDNGEL
jgi:hypothetical protein